MMGVNWRKVAVLGIGLLFVPACLLGQSVLLLKPTPINPMLLQGNWVGKGPGGDCSVTITGKVLRYAQPSGDESKEAFWFETTFTIPAESEYQQLHAIIRDSSPDKSHIGKVIVTLFKIENEQLSLGVIESLEKAPFGAVEGNWNDVIDEYIFSRSAKPAREAAAGSQESDSSR